MPPHWRKSWAVICPTCGSSKTNRLLLPAAASLALFAWLLTLHPTASGRVYAAYGGVYISVAMVWLLVVDKVRPSMTDWIGVAVSLLGMAIIILGTRSNP